MSSRNTHGVSLDTIPVFEMFQPVLPYMLNSWRSIALRQVTRAIQLDPVSVRRNWNITTRSKVELSAEKTMRRAWFLKIHISDSQED